MAVDGSKLKKNVTNFKMRKTKKRTFGNQRASDRGARMLAVLTEPVCDRRAAGSSRFRREGSQRRTNERKQYERERDREKKRIRLRCIDLYEDCGHSQPRTPTSLPRPGASWCAGSRGLPSSPPTGRSRVLARMRNGFRRPRRVQARRRHPRASVGSGWDEFMMRRGVIGFE